MCDGVVPTDSSFSMAGHQESVGAHVDAHSQHVVFDLVSFCGPFRHRLLRHDEGPIILTHGPKLRPLWLFRELRPARGLTQGQERGRPGPKGRGGRATRRIRGNWEGAYMRQETHIHLVDVYMRD